MKKYLLRLSIVGMTIGVVAFSATLPVAAHVTVKPAEAITAGFQTFTVSVPNEKEIPTVSVKIAIPDGVEHVSPTQKSGWTIAIEKDAGEIRSITWKDGSIAKDLRDEFAFSAQVPDEATELHWKAYQTYSDGTVVSWDQASSDDHGHDDNNSGPFSVTKVVEELPANQAVKAAQKAADDANARSTTAMYIAISAAILGLGGVYFGTRTRR